MSRASKQFLVQTENVQGQRSFFKKSSKLLNRISEEKMFRPVYFFLTVPGFSQTLTLMRGHSVRIKVYCVNSSERNTLNIQQKAKILHFLH